METRFLEIRSKGEIEQEALSLIGASTKKGDETKIGMFGSGLKYSISAMTRQNIPFVILSGENEIKVSTKPVNFRGVEFNKILINGQETSLTDTMGGEDWNGAFPFIREIYSNAKDEDENATIRIVSDFKYEIGYTKFLIEATPEILYIFENFENYFAIRDNALHISDKGSIHRATRDLRLFRKGILSYTDEKIKSIFNYDLDFIRINESRVISNIYAAQSEVAYILETMTDERMINKFITSLSNSNTGFFEHDCILPTWYGAGHVRPEFINTLLSYKFYPIEMRGLFDEKTRKERTGFPFLWLERFLTYIPDLDVAGVSKKGRETRQSLFVEKAPSTILFDKVQNCLDKLKETKYKGRLRNEIKYCAFHKESILGCADDNTIWLSVKLEDSSEPEISKIIIEEQEHLISGFEDETRSFQNHLFNLIYEFL